MSNLKRMLGWMKEVKLRDMNEPTIDTSDEKEI